MKIAVCGTYSSGKTTTSLALSYLTGIPATHALTMREILPVLFPGKRLENCTSGELVELIFQRMIHRVENEVKYSQNFISDGASIQEWAYCKPRMLYGMNPAEERIQDAETLSGLETFGKTIDAYGKMAKAYAKKHYDVFIHLPVEFPLVADGHRPVSEGFRKRCDELLRQAYGELGVPYFEVSGNIAQRLTLIIQKLNIPCIMDVRQAIILAKKDVKERFDGIKLENRI